MDLPSHNVETFTNSLTASISSIISDQGAPSGLYFLTGSATSSAASINAQGPEIALRDMAKKGEKHDESMREQCLTEFDGKSKPRKRNLIFCSVF